MLNSPIKTAVFLLLGLSIAASACNVPVFRYALEQWPADPYRLQVKYTGSMSAHDEGLLAPLLYPEEADKVKLNLWVIRDAIAGSGTEDTPSLKLLGPGEEQEPLLWTGPLSADTLATLKSSPARIDLARRLLNGDSVVWVLLDSGDTERDDATAAALQDLLTRLESAIKLPELTESDEIYVAEHGPELKLRFSILRLTRNAPEEAILQAIMLQNLPENSVATAPLLMPVFGRGRALEVLPLPKLPDPLIIEDMATFMCGPCSCLIKEENPGFDLLLAAAWEELLDGRYTLEEALPKLASPTSVIAAQEARAELMPHAVPLTALTAATQTESSPVGNVLIVLFLVAIIVVFASLRILHRKPLP